MGDLISRAAAIEAALDGADDWDGGYNRERERYIREHMANVPAVDAVPVVHARWQGISPFVDTEECSNCRWNIQSEELETPYCPWCGAKMDGERRENDATG